MTIIPENDYQIIPRSLIEAKACRAFFDGLPRSAHSMNWHASALACWLAAYDRCAIQYPHLALSTNDAAWLAEYDCCTANETKCTRPVWAGVDLAQKVGV